MINWGIIGCGDVTEVKSGPAFSKVANSRLLAVMRRNSVKAEDYARRHQVPLWFDDAQQIIDHPEINAVYVATPPSSHEQYAIAAAKAGKFVYLEKPMSISSSSAQNIADVVDQTNGKLCVAHYRRRQPMFLKIKSLLEEGIIGKVVDITMTFRQPPDTKLITQTEDSWRLQPEISGGGLFYDLAPHQLDLMLYYFGSPLTVAGSSANLGGFYKAPDTTTVEIQFRNQIHFRGHWSFVSDDAIDSCEITGTKGSIRFSVFDRNPVTLSVDGKQEMLSFEPLQHVQQPMIETVVNYFLGVGANPATAEEGVEVMTMIDACKS